MVVYLVGGHLVQDIENREGARCEVALSLTLVYCALSCLSERHTQRSAHSDAVLHVITLVLPTQDHGARNTLTAIVQRPAVSWCSTFILE